MLKVNNSPFMTKILRKAIIHRSKIKNIYNRKRTDDNWINYGKTYSAKPKTIFPEIQDEKFVG